MLHGTTVAQHVSVRAVTHNATVAQLLDTLTGSVFQPSPADVRVEHPPSLILCRGVYP